MLHRDGMRAGSFQPFGQRGGGMLLETWSGPWASGQLTDGQSITLRGSQRAYLVRGDAYYWEDVQYDKLRLLGRTIQVTVDMSGVGCGCNGAIYLVEAPQPDARGSRYCDMNSDARERCTAIDVMEANAKSIVTTIHTQAGQRADGSCNQWGCAQGLGVADGGCRYGPLSPNIDSSRPFVLSATFHPTGSLRTTVSQDGRTFTLFGQPVSNALPYWHGPFIPPEATTKVATALDNGGVFVTSLSGGEEGSMNWLDGGCSSASYPMCDITQATLTLSNLKISGGDAEPPWIPPPPRSPSLPPYPLPPCWPPAPSPNIPPTAPSPDASLPPSPSPMPPRSIPLDSFDNPTGSPAMATRAPTKTLLQSIPRWLPILGVGFTSIGVLFIFLASRSKSVQPPRRAQEGPPRTSSRRMRHCSRSAGRHVRVVAEIDVSEDEDEEVDMAQASGTSKAATGDEKHAKHDGDMEEAQVQVAPGLVSTLD